MWAFKSFRHYLQGWKIVKLEVAFVRRLLRTWSVHSKIDGEPDIKSHPGIEAVPTTLIAAVTHSEPPAVVEEEEMDCSETKILDLPVEIRMMM
jgi:hypothetical protein